MAVETVRPYCVGCGLPVQRATIMREAAGRGYLAIVHCHVDSEVVELGTELPSDNRIRSARAFAEGDGR